MQPSDATTQQIVLKKQRFFSEMSSLLGEEVTESTSIAKINPDSMMRSEIVFLTEDIFDVDIWEKVFLKDFETFGAYVDAALQSS